MVAGSGSQGLIIVAKPEIKTFQDLQGKKIGTFQPDTLDIPVYPTFRTALVIFTNIGRHKAPYRAFQGGEAKVDVRR